MLPVCRRYHYTQVQKQWPTPGTSWEMHFRKFCILSLRSRILEDYYRETLTVRENTTLCKTELNNKKIHLVTLVTTIL